MELFSRLLARYAANKNHNISQLILSNVLDVLNQKKNIYIYRF